MIGMGFRAAALLAALMAAETSHRHGPAYRTPRRDTVTPKPPSNRKALLAEKAQRRRERDADA